MDCFEMMKEVLASADIMMALGKITSDMPYETFICTMCMLFDEYAKSNDKNAPELSDTVNSLVTQVNEALGAF